MYKFQSLGLEGPCSFCLRPLRMFQLLHKDTWASFPDVERWCGEKAQLRAHPQTAGTAAPGFGGGPDRDHLATEPELLAASLFKKHKIAYPGARPLSVGGLERQQQTTHPVGRPVGVWRSRSNRHWSP